MQPDIHAINTKQRACDLPPLKFRLVARQPGHATVAGLRNVAQIHVTFNHYQLRIIYLLQTRSLHARRLESRPEQAGPNKRRTVTPDRSFSWHSYSKWYDIGCRRELFGPLCVSRRQVIDRGVHARPAPQVNVPKTKKAFCKGCKKHMTMKVTQYKTGKASLYAQGEARSRSRRVTPRAGDATCLKHL